LVKRWRQDGDARTESEEQRTESEEQRTESEEQRTKSRGVRLSSLFFVFEAVGVRAIVSGIWPDYQSLILP
jgi:Trk-type K+ transport system membrane component